MKNRVLIVDGLNTFIRNWAVNPTMDANGVHMGGMLGCLRSVKNLIRDTKCTKAIVAWDAKGGSRKRRSIHEGYKAGRKPRVNRHLDLDSPEESRANLYFQYDKARRYLEMLGVCQAEVEDCEADDVISYLCAYTYHETQKVIVSTDKDFYQLIDANTVVYSPSKKIYYGTGEIKEEVGLLPCNYVLARAMTGGGDGADNIHGIKGLGPKTVLKLFPFLGTKESSLSEVHEAAQALDPKTPNEKKLVEALLAGWDVIKTNVQLMQLTNPIISPQSARSIRYQVEKDMPEANATQIKLALLRDNIQLTDKDFFLVFNEYRARAIGARGEDHKNV